MTSPESSFSEEYRLRHPHVLRISKTTRLFDCDANSFRLYIGPYSFIDRHVVWMNSSHAIIGADVHISKHVTLVGDVQLGHGCYVLPRAIIVNSTFEPYSIIGGCPARTVGSRYRKEHVQALLQSKWWLIDPPLLHQIFAFYRFDQQQFLRMISPPSEENDQFIIHSHS